jgi:hypothetical protein
LWTDAHEFDNKSLKTWVILRGWEAGSLANSFSTVCDESPSLGNSFIAGLFVAYPPLAGRCSLCRRDVTRNDTRCELLPRGLCYAEPRILGRSTDRRFPGSISRTAFSPIYSSHLTLTPGTRLGVYEVTTPIGAGGMGEVYRATDTKLKRLVAIKILPSSVAADHDRLARFQREAEVLASLNHPHIAGIYGLEESGGTTAFESSGAIL